MRAIANTGADTVNAAAGKNRPKKKPSGSKVPDNKAITLFGRLRSLVTRQQLLCVLAGCVLAVASAMNTREVLNDGRLARDEPGGVEREYEIYVSGVTDSEERISVRVSPREYTVEEAAEKAEELMEKLGAHILGENDSLQSVSMDLKLPKSVAGYEGLRLSWYPEDTGLISYDGVVHNLRLEEPEDTALKVVISSGEFSGEYAVPVTVVPPVLDDEERMELLMDMIDDADASGVSDGELVLPEGISGGAVTYSEGNNYSWIGLLALGVLAAVLLGLKPGQDRRKKAEERERELLLDYSDMVSKLIVYMGAGLTVKNAWLRICETYRKAVKNNGIAQRAVYEEMAVTAGELEKGVSEGRAYMDFAHRCGLKCYLKLASILEQNRRTGDSRMESALLLEVQEAFEQRKNTARRIGEEAGTKLMLPLIISMVTVMAIVAVPAMLTLL